MPDIISLDIETLDTTSTAVVLSIGGASFNIEDPDTFEDFEDPARTFHSVLELQGQLNRDRTISASTLMWWLGQSKAAQAGVFTEGTQMDVKTALITFSQWVNSTEASYVMGNGNTFDNTIVRSLYADYQMEFPCAYWGDIDLRTMRVMTGDDKDKPKFAKGVQHNAKDDAIFQAICAQYYYAKMRG